ncbi:MAG TPA: hypothetical protein ENI69_00150 [Rhodospirillales bacterium]|nr:hypothetical protein [Rhodospirillales bacterium]
MKKTAPDLKDGCIINGVFQKNSWTTEIQCVLVERQNGVEKNYYLSQECRKENLPFSTGSLGGLDCIFQTDSCHEFLTYTSDGRFYELINYESVFPTVMREHYGAVDLGDSFLLKETTKEGWCSEVLCSERKIKVLTFSDALKALTTRDVPIRKLFLCVTWEDGGCEYRLYAPCRYVNYSNPGYEKREYIQPISGYVLAPVSKGVYDRGYIACATSPGKDNIVEFVSTKFEDPLLRIIKSGGVINGGSILEQLSSLINISAPYFDFVKKMKAEFYLYVYL